MFIVESIIVAILIVIPTWRIFRRAGFTPALSLLVLIPAIGWLIALAILAFSDWPAQRVPSTV